MEKNDILSSIKSQILAVSPGAKVMLFGSRAYGTPTDESDWDILILTPQVVNATLKRNIHDALFPISMKIAAFINTLTVQENEWDKSPAYYSLYQSISKRMVEL
jgi:predicted nucleotidyltransferase